MQRVERVIGLVCSRRVEDGMRGESHIRPAEGARRETRQRAAQLDLNGLGLTMAAGECKQQQRKTTADDTAKRHKQPGGGSVGSCGVGFLRALSRPQWLAGWQWRGGWRRRRGRRRRGRRRGRRSVDRRSGVRLDLEAQRVGSGDGCAEIGRERVQDRGSSGGSRDRDPGGDDHAGSGKGDGNRRGINAGIGGYLALEGGGVRVVADAAAGLQHEHDCFHRARWRW